MASPLDARRELELEAKLENAMDQEIQNILNQMDIKIRLRDRRSEKEERCQQKLSRKKEEIMQRHSEIKAKADVAKERRALAHAAMERQRLDRIRRAAEQQEQFELRQEALSREREQVNDRSRLEAEAKNEHIRQVKEWNYRTIEMRKQNIMAKRDLEMEKMQAREVQYEQVKEDKLRVENEKMEMMEAKRERFRRQQEAMKMKLLESVEEKYARTDWMIVERHGIIERLRKIKADHALKREVLREAVEMSLRTGCYEKVRQTAIMIRSGLKMDMIKTEMARSRSTPNLVRSPPQTGSRTATGLADAVGHRVSRHPRDLGEEPTRPATELAGTPKSFSRARRLHSRLQEATSPAYPDIDMGMLSASADELPQAFGSSPQAAPSIGGRGHSGNFASSKHSDGLSLFSDSPARQRAQSHDSRMGSPRGDTSSGTAPAKGSRERARSQDSQAASSFRQEPGLRSSRPRAAQQESPGIYNHLMNHFAEQLGWSGQREKPRKRL